MANEQESSKSTQRKLCRFGFLVSLFAFLPYFLLPLTYYVHLTASSLPGASRGLQTGSPIIASQTGEPASPHDSNACPICQGAESFQDYGNSPAFHAPDSNSQVGRLAGDYYLAVLTTADVLNSQTRAPPFVPLPQATA